MRCSRKALSDQAVSASPEQLIGASTKPKPLHSSDKDGDPEEFKVDCVRSAVSTIIEKSFDMFSNRSRGTAVPSHLRIQGQVPKAHAANTVASSMEEGRRPEPCAQYEPIHCGGFASCSPVGSVCRKGVCTIRERTNRHTAV